MSDEDSGNGSDDGGLFDTEESEMGSDGHYSEDERGSEGQHSDVTNEELIARVLRQNGRNISMFLLAKNAEENRHILNEIFDTMKDFRGQNMILMLLTKRKMTKPGLTSYGLSWENYSEKKIKKKFFSALPEKFWAVSVTMMKKNDCVGEAGLQVFKKEMFKTGINITFEFTEV